MKRRRKNWQLLLLIIFTTITFILAFFFFVSGPKEKIKAVAKEKSEGLYEPAEEKIKRQVTLYFPSTDDDLLHSETREIVAGPAEKEAAEIVAELISGSHSGYLSPLPSGTTLRQVFITREGTAFVDFSRELVEKHPSGSAAEMTTIYAVVNSLIKNIPAIKQVFILVEGSERETLSGHINLNQPFSFLSSLLAR